MFKVKIRPLSGSATRLGVRKLFNVLNHGKLATAPWDGAVRSVHFPAFALLGYQFTVPFETPAEHFVSRFI